MGHGLCLVEQLNTDLYQRITGEVHTRTEHLLYSRKYAGFTGSMDDEETIPDFRHLTV